LKKVRIQKIFSLSQLNCSEARCKYRVQELKKARPELRSLEKSGKEGSFDLACCLDRVAGTGGGGLIGGGGTGMGGEAMVGVEVGLVMS